MVGAGMTVSCAALYASRLRIATLATDDGIYKDYTLNVSPNWTTVRVHWRSSEANMFWCQRISFAPIPISLLALVATCIALLAEPTRSAHAAPIPVTNTNDSGAGSLRDALAIAAPGDVVTFSAAVSGMIVLTSGELVINKALVIDGPGADALTVSGNNASRVISITPGVAVTITGLEIANGNSAGQDGGGIFNAGALTLRAARVRQNRAGVVSPGSGSGGGIANVGQLLIADTVVLSNSANGGAGIYSTGTLTVVNSTIRGNGGGIGSGAGISSLGSLWVQSSTIESNMLIDGNGGGIYSGGVATVTASLITNNDNASGGGLHNTGHLSIVNTTISGNKADPAIILGYPGGGALTQDSASARVVIESSTIVSNNATSVMTTPVGGLYVSAGVLTFGRSIVAFNAGPENIRVGPGVVVITAGYNLSDGVIPSVDPPFSVEVDLLNTDPRIGHLADNGGPTRTHALLPGSPAINSAGTGCPASDQRGVARPQALLCDIGAYERAFSLAWMLPFIAK
jgi:predicted outer membrane repeat protein